jgi:dTDP-4-amino-4,6-dideoxygalactose transaminase
MIKFTGWERDYIQNKDAYTNIFDKAMLQSNIEDTNEFEHMTAKLFDRKYAIAVNNASDALHFSLLAYGIGVNDEVLVTDFSWLSTASCISLVGATPVFCDIDIETYHISLSSIKRMVTHKTKAIVYTHLFGSMSDTSDILDFCKNNNIVFIEDAAQSLGSSLNKVKAGSIGDCSSFSFNTNKVIAGVSGGGVFLTNDKDIADYVSKVRRHGKSNDFELLGYNSKTSMMLLNAEIIKYRMSNMVINQIRRQEIASMYDEVFEDLDINIQLNEPTLNHNYHKYTIRVDDRKKVMNELRNAGIQTSVHYDKPISENSMYEHIAHKKDNCINSKTVSNTIMSLPIHAWLTNDEVEKVANIVWANV